MKDFQLVSYAQEIIFGSGSIAKLAQAVEESGWKRLILCSSPSLRRLGHIAEIEAALGEKLVAIYAEVQAHVRDFQVDEAFGIAAEHKIDAVIGLGGGSAIGMAKAVSMAVEEKRTGQPARAAFPTDQPLIPVIAIPTTYAGSEMTPIYGITYTDGGISKKITVRDPKITPKMVIYDPDLTLELPREVTASSGINALAHCVEALYSKLRNPQATAAAQEGIRHICSALPRCTVDGSDREARREMFLGSHMAALALSTTKMGLHHGLCHILGGSAGVAHGVANSIILPHAIRFNMETTTAQLALAARAMGINGASQGVEMAAEALVDKVYDFIGRLGLPQRLRDVGVLENQIPHLAELALQNRAVQNNPKPITSAEQTELVLRAAW